jgi:hypothetical protein
MFTGGIHGSAITQLRGSVSRTGLITVSSKTTYYLNILTTGGSSTTLAFDGNSQAIPLGLVLRATCAYL